MESDRNPLTEESKVNHSDRENILIEDLVAEIPIPEEICSSDIQMLPPVILADLRYTFPDTQPIFTIAQQQRLELASTQSRKISWLCIIDCILVSFILYFGIFYLILIVIILPVLGFFTSRRFNLLLAYAYIIYGKLILGLRISLMIVYNEIPGYIIQGIIIALEAYIFYMIIKFIGVVKILTQFEKDFLLGRPTSGHQNVNNPEDAAVKIISNPPQVYRLEN